MRLSIALLAAFLTMSAALPAAAGDAAPAGWPQWGGPNRDFRAPAGDVATSWPEDGPERLWSRNLGAGTSAILFAEGRLYTMYRTGDDEVVVSLDAGTGTTLWEHVYEHVPSKGHVAGFGRGPNSTPLLAGDRVFTIGVAGKMHALATNDGRVVWTRDLWGEDFGGNVLGHGYSSSPIAYKDTVIVPVGGEQAGLVAFHQASGEVKWQATSFKNSFSSPRLLDVAGERQLVVFMAEELIGVHPASGELRWRYPHVNQWRHNITLPAIVDGDTIFLSSPQAGARGIRLAREGTALTVEEIWSKRSVQFYHGSTVRAGDWVYGSSGTMGPAFMTAINVRSGEVGWRERGIARANCVAAGDKLVILDENGKLYVAGATPQKLVVHASAKVLEKSAWTVPTLVGTTLYLRDNRRIMALDLG